LRRFLPLLVLLAAASAPALARRKPPEKIVVITNVNILETATGNIRPHQAVVIRKGRITAIAKRAIIQESPQIVIVNGEGKYLIPGLWDMRMHLAQGQSAEHVQALVLPLLLANGVTGVRDVSGDREALKKLQAEVESGAVAGPRLVFDARPGTAPAQGPVVVVRTPEEARAAVESFRKQRPGAGLLAGTDSAPNVAPGVALHRELQLLVEAGLTPLEALQTATLNPVRFLGKDKDLGEVEVGKQADLVLLDADPTEDIHNLDKIAGVVAAGRYFSRRELDEMLARAEAAAKDNQ
jgi:imidazolonepropionase-like amidohydrolase